MTREIKFRYLWHDDDNHCDDWRYLELPNDIYGENYFNKESNDLSTLTQYTGLKDKNGVEIYEGDIFAEMGGDHSKPHDYEYHGTVYFDEDFSSYCVAQSNGGWTYLHSYLDDSLNKRSLVVGNIYQNPELIINK